MATTSGLLYRYDLCIAVSGPLTAELSDATRLHRSLNDILTAVPSVLIKPADVILDEEVQAHPQRRTATLMQFPLNSLFGTQEFARYLSSPELAAARNGQRGTAHIWMQRLEDFKSTFPPSKTGRHGAEQADLFAWCLTVQQLSGSHAGFMRRFEKDVANFKVDVFLSAQIMGYVLFYKYYLTGRTPQDAGLRCNAGSDCERMLSTYHREQEPYGRMVLTTMMIGSAAARIMRV